MTATQSEIRDAVESLKAVLCDPEGKCCISGSDADRKIVDDAIAALNGDCGGGDHPPIEGLEAAINNSITYPMVNDVGFQSEHDRRVVMQAARRYLALTADNAKRGDNTAADTKMGDAVKALAAIENGTLVLDVMHTYECGSRHTGDCVCGAEENSKHITTIKKALSHDNAELGKVGEIFDKLTQYAEDSIGCQYGTLSADLVEKLAKEGLAIIDRLMGVKG
jgi:hypothetical protein